MFGRKFEDLFRISSKGFTLDKRYWQAIYKVRLMKYDGLDVGERNRGNIVCKTPFFAAKDDKDAKKKAKKYFDGASNPAFYNLEKKRMKVSYEFLDAIELIVPNFNDNYKNFGKNTQGCFLFSKVKEERGSEDAINDSFLGFKMGSTRRRMKHFNDTESCNIEYLYHPWHGAGDAYTDWFVYDSKNPFYYEIKSLFEAQHDDDERKFEATEFTCLNKDEQKKISAYLKLEWLDKQQKYYYENKHDRWEIQGEYIFRGTYGNHKDIPEFIRNKGSHGAWLWEAYATKEERAIELKAEIEAAQRRVDGLKSELEYM